MTNHLFDPSAWTQETTPPELGELVYFITDPGRVPQPVRIGWSKDPEERFKKHRSSWPHLRVLGTIRGGDRKLEEDLHNHFKPIRLSGHESWYELTPEIVDVACHHWLPEDIEREWLKRCRGVILPRIDEDNLLKGIARVLEENSPEDYADYARIAHAREMQSLVLMAEMTKLSKKLRENGVDRRDQRETITLCLDVTDVYDRASLRLVLWDLKSLLKEETGATVSYYTSALADPDTQ